MEISKIAIGAGVGIVSLASVAGADTLSASICEADRARVTFVSTNGNLQTKSINSTSVLCAVPVVRNRTFVVRARVRDANSASSGGDVLCDVNVTSVSGNGGVSFDRASRRTSGFSSNVQTLTFTRLAAGSNSAVVLNCLLPPRSTSGISGIDSFSF